MANNYQLKELLIGFTGFDNQVDEGFVVTKIGWKACSHVLCNATSIMDTYNSNHTLEKLCEAGLTSLEDRLLPEDLRALSIEKTARVKQLVSRSSRLILVAVVSIIYNYLLTWT